MSLSCIMIIKNGIKNGYPFIESIRSIVDIVDEFLISDGYSEDETYEYLLAATEKFPNVTLFRDEWSTSNFGESIADMTNLLKARAKCDWVYNLQADEILHEDILPKIKMISTHGITSYHSVALKFLHFVGDFFHVETQPGYETAIRLVPNTKAFFVAEDGWTFHGDVDPIGVIESPPVFHFGWVYGKDNIYKRMNQAQNIYRANESYIQDLKFCKEVEQNFKNRSEHYAGWQRKMLAYRRIRKYEGCYPKAALHLFDKGNYSYEPDTRVLDMEIPYTDRLLEPSHQQRDIKPKQRVHSP